MTNEELQRLTKVYIKDNSVEQEDLLVWASESYINTRRAAEYALPVCQHDHNEDIWVLEHEDGTEGIYFNHELARTESA